MSYRGQSPRQSPETKPRNKVPKQGPEGRGTNEPTVESAQPAAGARPRAIDSLRAAGRSGRNAFSTGTADVTSEVVGHLGA